MQKIEEKWDYYLGNDVAPNRSRDVSPLIDAEFDQGGSGVLALSQRQLQQFSEEFN